MSDRTQIDHFIPCGCYEGGLRIRGIEFEYTQVSESAYVYIFNLHSPLTYPPLTLWQRLKFAIGFLFGKNLYMDDATLDHKGVTKLRDVCQDALDRWPDDHGAVEKGGGWDEIYQSLEDEAAGRELRLKKSS